MEFFHSLIFSDLEGSVADQETRLMAPEENIQGIIMQSSWNSLPYYEIKFQPLPRYLIAHVVILLLGLQMIDVELDARITVLEENSDGSSENGNL